MSSVIENYKTAYEEQQHVVEKIRVGLPVCTPLLFILLVMKKIVGQLGYIGQI